MGSLPETLLYQWSFSQLILSILLHLFFLQAFFGGIFMPGLILHYSCSKHSKKLVRAAIIFQLALFDVPANLYILGRYKGLSMQSIAHLLLALQSYQ